MVRRKYYFLSVKVGNKTLRYSAKTKEKLEEIKLAIQLLGIDQKLRSGITRVGKTG